MKIIIYQSYIAKIGGIETFTYNLCKQLSKYHDVTLLYSDCDSNQLERLKKVTKVEKYYNKRTYICDICILASAYSGYPESVFSTRNEYIQTIHANYEALARISNWKYKKWHKTTRHLAVSQSACEAFTKMYDEKATVMSNILDEIDSNDSKKLKLISATRLTSEKGYDRMVKLAEILIKNNVNYEWDIYTDINLYGVKEYPYFNYKETTLDLKNAIQNADYGIQLSDTESFCYFMHECLQLGTPVIATDFECARDVLEDGKNGYIFDYELSNVNIDKIINNIPKDFEYKPKATINDWLILLNNIENEKKVGEKRMVEILIKENYIDIQLGRSIKRGEKIIVSLERAEEIGKVISIEILRTIEETKAEEKVEDKKEKIIVKKGGKNANK